MALTTRSAGQSPIDSSAVNQFVQIFTGSSAQSDQQITFGSSVFVQKLTSSQGIVGSSNLTITGGITGSSQLNISSTLNVLGPITGSSTLRITGAMSASTLASSSALSINDGASSSQFAVMHFGLGSSSTYQRPGFYVGSSFPSIVGPAPGSLFFLMGGTSSNAILIAGPNAGTGSSSNWYQITGLSSAQ